MVYSAFLLSPQPAAKSRLMRSLRVFGKSQVQCRSRHIFKLCVLMYYANWLTVTGPSSASIQISHAQDEPAIYTLQ